MSMINTLKNLQERVNDIHGLMGNHRRQKLEESKENAKKTPHDITKMINIFDTFVSRLVTGEKIINKLENRSVDIS